MLPADLESVLTRAAFRDAVAARARLVELAGDAAELLALVHVADDLGDALAAAADPDAALRHLSRFAQGLAGGGLALLKTDDRVRIDLRKGTANILTSKAELARRRKALQRRGGFRYPASQTPWQEIQRSMVDQLADGMVLKPAVKYQRVAQHGVARDNH